MLSKSFTADNTYFYSYTSLQFCSSLGHKYLREHLCITREPKSGEKEVAIAIRTGLKLGVITADIPCTPKV